MAAEELHLTQSAVSRHIKEFEQIVGTELFRRAGRCVLLTDVGKVLASELSVDLDNIHRTVMRAVSTGGSGVALHIATLPTFSSRWLIPRLPEFSARYPDIQINLSTYADPFDMDRQHFDLAIHFGADDWPGGDAQVLCSETLIAVSSLAFQKIHEIDNMEKLAHAPLLHMNTRRSVWQDFFSQAKIEEPVTQSGMYFDQFSMIIAGAVASLGAAIIPTYLIENELNNNTLVVLDPHTVTTKNNYYLITPTNKQNKHVDVFADWMRTVVKS